MWPSGLYHNMVHTVRSYIELYAAVTHLRSTTVHIMCYISSQRNRHLWWYSTTSYSAPLIMCHVFGRSISMCVSFISNHLWYYNYCYNILDSCMDIGLWIDCNYNHYLIVPNIVFASSIAEPSTQILVFKSKKQLLLSKFMWKIFIRLMIMTRMLLNQFILSNVMNKY